MTLQALIEKRGPIKKIGVIGMGYVGIPAAALFAESPFFSYVLRVPEGFSIIRI